MLLADTQRPMQCGVAVVFYCLCEKYEDMRKAGATLQKLDMCSSLRFSLSGGHGNQTFCVQRLTNCLLAKGC